jgi:hypothetical protein
LFWQLLTGVVFLYIIPPSVVTNDLIVDVTKKSINQSLIYDGITLYYLIQRFVAAKINCSENLGFATQK